MYWQKARKTEIEYNVLLSKLQGNQIEFKVKWIRHIKTIQVKSQKRCSSCEGRQHSTSSAVTKDSLCISDSSMAEDLSTGYGISFFFSIVWE